MLTDAELSEIRERLEKATPGPWVIAVHDYSMADIHSTTKKYGDMSPVLSVSPCEGCQDRAKEGAEKEGRKPKWEWGRCTVGVEADWRFIAHAPTDMAALLAEVERLNTGLRVIMSKLDHIMKKRAEKQESALQRLTDLGQEIDADDRLRRLAYRLFFLNLFGFGFDNDDSAHTPARKSFEAYWDTDPYFREKWSRHAGEVLAELGYQIAGQQQGKPDD